jgi:hypothetical protein
MTPVEWRRVQASGAEPSAARYESSTGEQALVVPVDQIEVVGPAGDAALVAFVDPATPVAARGLLRALDDESVVVALPGGAGGTGLVAAGGRVVAPDGTLDLYRLSGRGELDASALAEPERIGEDADSLKRRGDWFEGRHGPAG